MRTRCVTLLAAAGLSLALAHSASAADLSMPPIYKAPPPAYFSWTGWYVGANGGFRQPLIVGDDSVEFFQQVENDVGLPVGDGAAQLG